MNGSAGQATCVHGPAFGGNAAVVAVNLNLDLQRNKASRSHTVFHNTHLTHQHQAKDNCIMEDQQFIHKPLNREIDEVRLLVLQPCDNPTSKITCKIIHARLSNRPKYAALSYMWGSDANSRNIDIGGKSCRIGHNLWLALLELRLGDRERIMWIDAICINQEDSSERNHQVGQMSLIYSQSLMVIVWLGPETEDSREAIPFLKKLAGLMDIHPTKHIQFEAKWNSVKKLCEMGYWKRLWIIQEVVLAPQIVLLCGKDMLFWDEFMKILYELSLGFAESSFTNRGGLPVMDSFEETIPSQLERRRKVEKLQAGTIASPLLENFFTFKDAACKDSRDKLFGLYSLSMECCREHTPVDYFKTAFDLCNSALEHHIDEHVVDKSMAERMRLAYEFHSAFSDFGGESIHWKTRDKVSEDAINQKSRQLHLIGTIIYVGPLNHFPTRSEYMKMGSEMRLSASNMWYLYCAVRYLRYPQSIYTLDVEALAGSYYDVVAAQKLRGPNSLRDSSALPILRDIHKWKKWIPNLELSETCKEISKPSNGQYGLAGYVSILYHIFRQHPDRYQPEFQVNYFIDNNGLIGFVPKEVRPGDIICETNSPRVISIVRQTDLGYETIVTAQKKFDARDIHTKVVVTGEESSDLPSASIFYHLLQCHLDFVAL